MTTMNQTLETLSVDQLAPVTGGDLIPVTLPPSLRSGGSIVPSGSNFMSGQLGASGQQGRAPANSLFSMLGSAMSGGASRDGASGGSATRSGDDSGGPSSL